MADIPITLRGPLRDHPDRPRARGTDVDTPPVAGNADVVLGERAAPSQFVLRGSASADDGALPDAFRDALGVELPLEPNTFRQHDELLACWRGPDEWLLLAGPTAADGHGDPALATRLQPLLAARRGFLVDVSGGQAVLTVSGPRARATLAKGCTLDLHPRALSPGRCAQTLLGKTGVLLLVTAEDGFLLVVRRSFSVYAWTWLLDAAGDSGPAVG